MHRWVTNCLLVLFLGSIAGAGACDCGGMAAGADEGERTGEGEGEGEGEGDPNAPLVTIVAPADNAFFALGQTISFTCTATDPQDGPIPNGDIEWSSSIDGGIGVGATVQTALASLGTHTIRCAATDSDGRTGSDTVTISIVDNLPPTCSILAPANGAQIAMASTVSFTASCTDADGVGPIANADIAWTSDPQGPLGLGSAVATALVIAGPHVISVCAADTEDAAIVGCASISITVVSPPTVTIDAPLDGSTWSTASAIAFSGTATDAEDGALVPVWRDSLTGDFASGSSAMRTLIAGKHEVTLRASDTSGLTATDTVTIYATPDGAPMSSLYASRGLGAPVQSLSYDAASATLWASTDGGGLVDVALDLSGSTAFTTGNSDVPDDVVSGAAIAGDGTLYIASDGGLASCAASNPGTCAAFGADQLALSTDEITAVVVLADGRVVVGTTDCLMFSSFEQGSHERYCDGDGGAAGLNGDRIRDLAVDPTTGDVYVVTPDGVSRMEPGDAPSVGDVAFERVDVGVDEVRAVAVASSGDVCFASDQGVAWLDGGSADVTVFDENDGLPSDDVRDVAIDDVSIDGSLHHVCWAATNGGLGRVDAQVPSVVGLTSADGLPDNDCRAIVVLPDHTKVIGTSVGVFSYSGL